MGSLSGVIQRPLVAAFAVAVASVSTDFSDKFQSHSNKPLNTSLSIEQLPYNNTNTNKNLNFISKIRVPVPILPSATFPIKVKNLSHGFAASSVSSSQLLHDLYLSVKKAPQKPSRLEDNSNLNLGSNLETMYRWHLPDNVSERSRTVVVLLGWLGAKQKHLKRYAEWYTSRGFQAITFTFPISEIISYQVGKGRAEEHVSELVDHLIDWLDDEDEKLGKNLVFHTFSNTGWLMYGAILERFQIQDPSLMGKIRGCVVDSAPVATPDPQVWASGFSAAFLKKHSVATKGVINSSDSGEQVWTKNEEAVVPKPAVTETALLLVLEKFFGVVLNLPTVNRRLSDVLKLLSTQQPSCPQLYIYSSADRVIPYGSVESFIEKQRKSGREVRACNFVSTPHVDHFRNDPKLYTSQLTQFLEDCVLTSHSKIPVVQPVE